MNWDGNANDVMGGKREKRTGKGLFSAKRPIIDCDG